MSMRPDIVEVVNNLSMKSNSLDIDLIGMYDLIFNYCKDNKKHLNQIKCELNNGILVIDGINIKRVIPLVKKVSYSEEADYYENLILERQEAYYEDYM